MPTPEPISPEQLPDVWLLETRHLLLELDRAREAVLRIPENSETRGPVKAAVDYIWDLRQRVFELAALKAQMQRSWGAKESGARTECANNGSRPAAATDSLRSR